MRPPCGAAGRARGRRRSLPSMVLGPDRRPRVGRRGDGSHWGATRGALWCPVRREDRQLEDPKGKPLEAMCRTWDSESSASSQSAPRARQTWAHALSCFRAGLTPTRGRTRVLEWPTSRLTTVPWPARKQDRLVIFSYRVSAGSRSPCVSESGPATQPSLSSAWALRVTCDPLLRARLVPRRKPRGRRAPSSAARRQEARRRAAPRLQDQPLLSHVRYLIPSTSLPSPGPRPCQPWARDQPYERLAVRSTLCRRARLSSTAERALRVLTVMLLLIALCVLPRAQPGSAERSWRASECGAAEETRGGERVIRKPCKITTDGEDEFVCATGTSHRNSCTSAVL